MTAQQLKNSILQMAVQGKLVPQDPGDEPASVLLERIKAEKQELIKAGKIKKDKKSSEIFRGASRNLPYAYCEQIGKEIRDISDEIPFEIPDSWEWVRLKSICTKLVDGDHNPPKGEMNETEYLMISSTNINNDRIENLDKVRYLSKEVFEQENLRTQATKGDIFFTSVGSLGRSCVYSGEYNLAFQRSVSVISTLIFNYYLKYCFDSGYFQVKVLKEATGTAQKGFYLNQLAESLIPVPPLSEQYRIVAKIEELLPYIERYGKAEEHLTALNTTFPEALKKSILQEAVQGKLVPQNPDDEPASVLLERIRAEKQALIKAGKIKKDKHESVIVTRDKIPYEIIDGKERCIADEVPFELPEGWCWCRLKNIVSLLGDGIHGTPEYSEIGEYYFINGNNLSEGRIIIKDDTKKVDESQYLKYKKELNETTVFVSINGTIGNIAFYNNEPVILGKSACYFNLIMKEFKAYIYWLLKTDYFLKYAITNATGSTIKNVSLKTMNDFYVPLPPLAEQKRIVEKIKELMQYCDKL